MDAKTLETTYAQAIQGFYEPEAIYASGREHKRLANALAIPEPIDVNGNPLIDSIRYVLTSGGKLTSVPE